MPKERRRRIGGHEPSVRLPNRHFAVQENAVEHVDLGAQANASATEIFSSMAEQDAPQTNMKKKEKQALKHELFLKRLESSRSPYSKSHERRLRRKEKEQVAGGMSDMKAAISAVESIIPDAVVDSTEMPATETAEERPKARKRVGKIVEGKGLPLSKSQRKRVLQTERLRIPMILSTPEFASNPFQTIRIHAQNTLLKHQPPN
ncbi:ribosome biogenesis protein SLX9-domain-containing protein [Sparassis latifolia]